MNTDITPGFTTYPTTQGQDLRIFGVVRGTATGSPNDVSDQTATDALQQLGFNALTYYPNGAVLPADWPTDEPSPQITADEKVFRAEGIWQKSSPLPTATSVAGGALILFAVWNVTPDVAPPPPITVSGGFSSPSNLVLWIGGTLLGLGVVGAYLLNRKGRLYENPSGSLIRRAASMLPYASPAEVIKRLVNDGNTKEDAALAVQAAQLLNKDRFGNPIQYDTTINYHGFMIHVHKKDDSYCADYRSIELVSPGNGGEVCSSSRDYVIGEAKRRIDVLYVRAQKNNGTIPSAPTHKRSPSERPSPWD